MKGSILTINNQEVGRVKEFSPSLRNIPLLMSQSMKGELYQFRFLKSKKKRIRNKWKKKLENYREKDILIQFGNQLIASEQTYNKLIKKTLEP